MHPDHCGGTGAASSTGEQIQQTVAAARSTSLTTDDRANATHQQNLPDLHDQYKDYLQVLQLQYQILDFVLLATTRSSCPSLTSCRRRRIAETLWWTALGRVWKNWTHITMMLELTGDVRRHAHTAESEREAKDRRLYETRAKRP